MTLLLLAVLLIAEAVGNDILVSQCDCLNCTTNTVAEAQCTGPDSEGLYRTYECVNEPAMCATLGYASRDPMNHRCSEYDLTITTACGTCRIFKDGNGTRHYIRFDCFENNGTVMFSYGCNADCDNCNGGMSMIPYSGCGRTSRPNAQDPDFAQNNGLTPCTVVTESVYNNTDCTGDATLLIVEAQDVCNFANRRVQCKTQPTIEIAAASRAVVSTCGYVDFAPNICEACEQHEIAVDTCSTIPPVGSTPERHVKASCSRQPGRCADMGIYTSNMCNGSFSGQWTAVCGSCIHDRNGTGYRMQCIGSDLMFDSMCDSNCRNCRAPNTSTIRFNTCDRFPVMIEESPFYTLHRGIFPCETVEYFEYSDSTCQNLTRRSTVSSGHCEYVSKLQCLSGSSSTINSASFRFLSVEHQVGLAIYSVALFSLGFGFVVTYLRQYDSSSSKIFAMSDNLLASSESLTSASFG